MSAPGNDEKHLELKVGAMILIALVLLVTFILILGDWSLKEREDLNVFFQNPGGLSSGAAVKVAGRKVGVIEEMTFLGQTGPRNPISGLPSLVRAKISVEKDVYTALRQDAKFYVTTKGVLGDPFLEISPGVSPATLKPGQPVFGIDPPRLDLFVADAYELVVALNALLERNNKNLDQILGSGARLLSVADDMVGDGGPGSSRIDRITTSMEELITETRELVTGAKTTYIDDPKVSQAIANMASLSKKLDREIDPLLAEIKSSLKALESLSSTIGPEEQKKIKASIHKLDTLMTRADRSLVSMNKVVGRIERGEGTVGQLLADEEIYDDLKELIRDIKRHPWKIIWED